MLTWLQFISVSITSYGIVVLTTPYIKKISLKLKLLDNPNQRRIHKKPTPNSGGIAIFLSMLPCLIYLSFQNTIYVGLLTSATFIISLGILDDKININPKIKLLGQCIAIGFLLFTGTLIHGITNPLGGFLAFKILSYPITICWLIGIINAFNLIDGVDGLASSITSISCVAFAIISIKMNDYQTAMISFSLLASTLAFLKFNNYPAKIFLGDSGSMLIGLVMGFMSINGVLKSTLSLTMFCPLLILAFPLSDTAYTIFRRLKNKQKLFSPDKKHFHHQLLDKGLSPPQIVLVFSSVSGILSAVAIIITLPQEHRLYASILVISSIGLITKSLINTFKKKV